jgi:Flp pilus assembly protein TadD
MRVQTSALVLLLALGALVEFGALAGCSPRSPKAQAAPAVRAQALIDSGNAAYKQGDYRLAVRRYAAAAAVRKDDPAAYYGMGMALQKLGRDEEARVAYTRARTLAHGAAGDESKPQHP